VSTELPQVKILGQPVNLSSNYLRWIADRLERGLGTHVITMNAEIVMQANQNPILADILQQADLITADGSGIVLALSWYGIKQTKCAGVELGEALLRLANDHGDRYPVFFYGGKPEIVTKAAHNWQEKLPNLKIVGVENGYLGTQEQADLEAKLLATQPRIILVALGVPRQEIWIRDHRHLCPDATWVGVGGSFDVWSGVKKRAPKLFQHLNLEWLYRFAQEPSRWRRMLALPEFAILALMERLRSKSSYSNPK
jgi:N-acetylglucosaminyldiphosphoundecaprenol N-acetyl-beta-D-mannosaminyltransferase